MLQTNDFVRDYFLTYPYLSLLVGNLLITFMFVIIRYLKNMCLDKNNKNFLEPKSNFWSKYLKNSKKFSYKCLLNLNFYKDLWNSQLVIYYLVDFCLKFTLVILFILKLYIFYFVVENYYRLIFFSTVIPWILEYYKITRAKMMSYALIHIIHTIFSVLNSVCLGYIIGTIFNSIWKNPDLYFKASIKTFVFWLIGLGLLFTVYWVIYAVGKYH